MSPKLMIATFLMATLVPVWIAAVATSFTRKTAALGAAIVAAAGICYLIGGFELSIVAVGASYGAIVIWMVGKAVGGRIARARLSGNSRPERSDLERWARKALRRQGWSVEDKGSPPRLIARKDGCTEFHLFCATDGATLGSMEARTLQHHAARTSLPVILLLFGGAPPTLVASLRSQKVLPVSQKDFLRHLEQATSRKAFIDSCRNSVIEEARFGVSTYAPAAEALTC